jgi:SAM-dependent methyltransferase
MTPNTAILPQSAQPDYGVDAPSVLRNLFLFGTLCLLLSLFIPHTFSLGHISFSLRITLRWTGGFLLAEGFLFLLYVKAGKFKHRDLILGLHTWSGDEQVLDVGCGRGLLLAGAARLLTTGHATGIDLWSNVDMGANSPEATRRNLEIEGVAGRCSIVSVPAQEMTFPDGAFDVVVSNLCLHNIYDRTTRQAALAQIVRVLKPGGIALISDYKRTGEYAKFFAAAGLTVTRRRGNILSTFPPLTIVIARKPA